MLTSRWTFFDPALSPPSMTPDQMRAEVKRLPLSAKWKHQQLIRTFKLLCLCDLLILRRSSPATVILAFIKANNSSVAADFITGNQKLVRRAHLAHLYY